MRTYSYGGGIINDTLLQFTNRNLPFGGIGKSGMGAYHGKHSFSSFSHDKPFIQRSSWPDPSMRYAPYKKKMKFLTPLLKWLGQKRRLFEQRLPIDGLCVHIPMKPLMMMR